LVARTLDPYSAIGISTRNTCKPTVRFGCKILAEVLLEFDAASTKRGRRILHAILVLTTAKDTNIRITCILNLERFVDRTFLPFVCRCAAVKSLGGRIGWVLASLAKFTDATISRLVDVATRAVPMTEASVKAGEARLRIILAQKSSNSAFSCWQ
jgi:hypothetical protein